jgi:hypothetical protein
MPGADSIDATDSSTTPRNASGNTVRDKGRTKI